jgi:L-histidine N-alpha-methyltransferase
VGVLGSAVGPVLSAAPEPSSDAFWLDRHLEPGQRRTALEADVRAGLTATPKALPPKWFYDARGSQLFDQITKLPEYYPTRLEKALLREHADDVARLTGAGTLVELGSGTSEKTTLVLDALRDVGTLQRFVPFDVDEWVLREAGAQIAERYPGVAVHAVVGDFEHHLDRLPLEGRSLVAFLGGTIGNLVPSQRTSFLRALSQAMSPGDWLLLGTDLVKDVGRLVRAYDDAAGVTAEFNRNVLHVLVRELDAKVDVDAFEHLARWDAEREWIEMHLRATVPTVIRVLDLDVPFEAGETVCTEVSAKFRRAGVEDELAASGFVLQQWWTDPDGDYAVSVSRRSD